ncbi:hypothetical protein QFC19_001656 [Naganishia cerealis]|uniref:Uncharacterized protein n=1 Tax=Naganishia cerealis TaxID=610337 RepID=A0ACC2WFR9_9TREE|nr:hypothetical protein QFC19_001656 [Naganishia cerealis]
MSNSNIDSRTYHSGENNDTTGREPFEDTSRDFIHGGNTTSAAGTGIPGTFGAGVGNTGTGHTGVGHTGVGHTGVGHTGTTHQGGLTGAGAGATTGAGLTGRHGRRGSASSSSSSSSEEVDGVRRKKDRSNRPKKPIGQKVKEAVGLGGAGAGATGASRTIGHDQSSSATGIHSGATGIHSDRVANAGVNPTGDGPREGQSHGVTSLHGNRDAYNESAGTRGDINTGTTRDPAVHSSGLGGLSGSTRQTGDVPGGIQSGTTSYGTGHNLASEARDHTTGSHHTGTGVGSGVGAGGLGASSGNQYGSGVGTGGLGSSQGNQYGSGVGTGAHTGTGVGSGVGTGGLGSSHGIQHGSGVGAGGLGASSGNQYGSNTAASNYDSTTSGLGEDRSAGYARTQGGPGNEGITGHNLSGAAGTDRFDVDRASSGVTGGAYGQSDVNKQTDSGLNRHQGDFTNNQTATGGAYSNPEARTGLTGREHTTTGVPDQHGNATHTTEGHSGTTHTTEGHSGGLIDKVKGMLGGHSSTGHST